MSAYNDYSTNGYGGGGGDDSGGFFAGSQQGSQGGGKQTHTETTMRPVTIKQIVDCEEVSASSSSEFKLDGVPLTQITLVGQIRNVNNQATNTTFRLDDETGQIEAKKWTDGDNPDATVATFEVDSYLRVFGTLKSFGNKRYIAIQVMRPVTDFNEVNYHKLEATYVHLFNTQGALGQKGANGDSMFVDGGDGYGQGAGANGGGNGVAQSSSKLASCSPAARRMFQAISSASGGNEGSHLQIVSSETKMSAREVLEVADELLAQGLIYTTVDDETWAVLEY